MRERASKIEEGSQKSGGTPKVMRSAGDEEEEERKT